MGVSSVYSSYTSIRDDIRLWVGVPWASSALVEPLPIMLGFAPPARGGHAHPDQQLPLPLPRLIQGLNIEGLIFNLRVRRLGLRIWSGVESDWIRVDRFGFRAWRPRVRIWRAVLGCGVQ